MLEILLKNFILKLLLIALSPIALIFGTIFGWKVILWLGKRKLAQIDKDFQAYQQQQQSNSKSTKGN